VKGSRFLVTGGSGFIGSHVVERLLEADAAHVVVFDQEPKLVNLNAVRTDPRVRLVEGDVRDAAAVSGAARNCDGIFHLAVLPLGPCHERPRECLEVNVVGTFNVVEAAVGAGVRKVVFSSASSVYGDTDDTMAEDHPLGAWTLYGATKVAGEYILRAFHDRDELEFVVLRYMNVYGPRQEGGLVMSVVRRLLAGQPPTIDGDGSQSFDFVHVADVASANVAAMESQITADFFNVGSGREASVREIVERLVAATDANVEPEYRPDARVLMKRRVGSSEKAQRLLGWSATRELDEGLRDVVEAARG
jgi:UDP-glucose 4-epimerase